MFATVKISITDLSQKRSDHQDAALVSLAMWDRTTETNDVGRQAVAEVPKGLGWKRSVPKSQTPEQMTRPACPIGYGICRVAPITCPTLPETQKAKINSPFRCSSAFASVSGEGPSAPEGRYSGFPRICHGPPGPLATIFNEGFLGIFNTPRPTPGHLTWPGLGPWCLAAKFRMATL